MPIEFPCRCGQQLRVPDANAGQVARCPRCKRDVTVPHASVPPEIADPLGPNSLSSSPLGSNPFAEPTPERPAPAFKAPLPSASVYWFVKTPDEQRHGPLTQREM